MKKIAVLAWGSLLCDQRDLEIATKFEPTGPRLPIEFCRVRPNSAPRNAASASPAGSLTPTTRQVSDDDEYSRANEGR
jgi:hypothetical protein